MQRSALAGGLAAAGGLLPGRLAADSTHDVTYTGDGLAPGQPGADYTAVVTPNNPKLPWKIVDDVKVFNLVAEEVDHEFTPGLKGTGWGYNGSIHGPTIEAVEGDRVRIYVTNHLTEGTTVHWHGILLPNGMDGVGGLTQKVIQPGETYKYEFVLRQAGTYMYHPHHDEMTQLALGMMGLFIIHPRTRPAHPPDRDFAIMLSEWRIIPGTSRPDPMEMTDFNVLTMNGRVFPGTEPLVVQTGQRVRIRFGNLGAMEHHPIHLHGYQFRMVEIDGNPIPESVQWMQNTVLVSVGSTHAVEFIADAPGDWAMHCHMSHHVMNQMGHAALNLIGVDTDKVDAKVRKALIPGFMQMGQDGMAAMGDMNMGMPRNSIPMQGGQGQFDPITMGGMFTILKVRDRLANYDDPGWYAYPGAPKFAKQGAELADTHLGCRHSVRPGGFRVSRLRRVHSRHRESAAEKPNRHRMSFYRRLSEARAAVLEAAIRKFVAVAKRHADIEAVYAFGSVAEQRVGPKSDLDLLVVRETALVGPERGVDLVVEAQLDVPCDIVVVTPAEYRERLPLTSFGRTILATARRVDAA